MGTGSTSTLTLHECKVRASLLLKDLDSPDTARATRAAERMRALPFFASLPLGQVLARRDTVKHKHGLTVIAREAGHATWALLKQALESVSAPGLDTRVFFQKGPAVFLNRWCATYEEAAASLAAQGGFLFPFRHQYFVCEAGFLQALGIDVKDPDWERLGHDWVRPRDPAAKARLEAKLVALGYGGQHVAG
ncbi:hypothetical protein D7X74_24415 [Corallococcus sp. CA047B]|uniref:hypothetical protein n=1 Tax=Corallococcus sp. CA047B TaxID=2316729 RepID=UPI000EA29BE1|nr:hypothetical protein [Corallococcus sp. CA047B]RKH11970.1 hypothetical protein D7X74_24415 [Corallococcus sp. CA047B]